MPQNEMAPWGDAGQPPCGCNQSSTLLSWIQANPWLAAGIAAALILLFTSGGERQ